MNNEDSEFLALPGHDASAAIRGFFYQINVTILRWLELPPEGHLELEAGEDIDIVRDIFPPGRTRYRALEQIKNLKTNLTLRSPELLAPLGRFLSHQQSNPNFQLEFRYLTTASVGQERPSACNEPLITFWSELRKGARSADSTCFRELRTLLAGAPQPGGVTTADWQAFSYFFSSASQEQIINFIGKVRLDLAQLDNAALKPKVEEILVARSLCSPDEAGIAYARLVFYVIELLSRSGFKRLGGEDLKQILGQPAERRDLLAAILDFESLTAAVQSHTTLLRDDIQPKISRIEADVRQLVSEQWASERYSSAIDVTTAPPEPVTHAVIRTGAVELVLNELKANVWVSLTGTGSSGKTQLALQACSALGVDVVWVNLKGRSVPDSLVHLGRCLSVIAKRPISPLIREGLSAALSNVPPGSALVVDDLPGGDVTDRLDEALVLLGNVCEELNLILLTTSPRSVSRYVRDRAHRFSEITAPPFSNEDVIALLKLFKASDDHMQPWFVEYIKLVTQNSPLLLRAAAQHCEAKGWPLLDTISDLLGNHFADDVNADTMRLLESTVGDERTRDLIYRLQAIGPRFTIDEVRIAAAIAPTIAHPLERVELLNGIWIEKDSQSEYIISPRVARLSKGNLPVATYRQLHLAVASSILRKRVLDQLDVVKAVMHYIAAEDLQSALTVLLLALRAFAVTTEPNPDDWIITSIWYDVELPAEFSTEDRIELRTAQVLARRNVGKDARHATLDLLNLLQGAGSILPKALVPGAIVIALELSSEKPVEAARLLRDAIRAVADEQTSSPALAQQIRLHAAQLLWGPGSYCRVNEELFEWFGIVFELAPDELDAMCHSEIAYQATRHICDGIWDREGRLPEGDRRWSSILESLDELCRKAIRTGARPFIAGLSRAIIVVLMDYLRDSERACSVATDVIPLLRVEPAGENLVATTIGQQYYFLDMHAEAEPWLNRAVELESYGQLIDRIYAFLYAGIVRASSSPSDAVTLIGQATELALSNDDVSQTLKVRVLGERAIAIWRASGLDSAYESLRDAAELLLGSDLSRDTERSLFRLFGNWLGYFVQVASGQSSADQSLGPEPGLYLDFSTRFAGSFTSGNVWFMEMQLSHLAEELGRESDATKFAARALERPDVEPDARWALVMLIAGQKAADGDYAGIVGLWSTLTTGPMPSYAPSGSERAWAGVFLIVIGLSLAAFRLQDGERAGSRVADAVLALGGISNLLPAAEEFHCAASFVEKAFSWTSGGYQLIELGNKEESTAFRVLSYLSAMFELSPAGAFRALWAILPAVKKLLPTSMYRILVVPFVRSFWRVTFERSAFAFSTPRLVERQIKESLAIEGEASLLPLLAAVARGLGIRAPEEI